MKTTTKKTDQLLHSLIALLKKSGTRCGTGDQMSTIRKQKR